MSAAVRSLSVHLSRRRLSRQSTHFAYFSSCNVDSESDFLTQFSPFGSGYASCSVISPYQRRMLTLGISKMVKHGLGHLLVLYSKTSSPNVLVNIMESMGERQAALAFFKYVFRDHSDWVIQRFCGIVHSLVGSGLRYVAHDVLTRVIWEIGEERSYVIVWEKSFRNSTDFYVLDVVMRSFTDAEMASCVLEVVDRIRGVGLRPSRSAIGVLMNLLLRFGDQGSVWKLLREMIRKGPIPSSREYNVMIGAFCKRNCIRIAESVFYVMRKYGCEPNAYCYNILMNAYCVRGWTPASFKWMHLMVESGCPPDCATFSTLIGAYVREGNIAKAKKIFSSMTELGVSPNVVCYNAMIAGYIKAGEIEQANMLYEEMRSNGVEPDGVTFVILAAAHERYGGKRLLKNLSEMALVPYYSQPDVCIAALCWVRRLDEAFELLGFMLEKGICVGEISFSSLILAYCKQGLKENAFEVYNFMVKIGCTPTAYTYTSLLVGLSILGSIQEAKSLMYEIMGNGYPINMFLNMLRKGLVPTHFTYHSLMSGFCNRGEVDEALRWELEMRHSGLLPNVTTMSIIIKGYCMQARMKSAMATFMEMLQLGWTPDSVTYTTLIRGYCRRLDMSNAEKVVDMMRCNGCSPDIVTYNTLIQGYCRSQMDKAVMKFNELISVGLVPDTVTYNILLSGVCRYMMGHDRNRMRSAKTLLGKLLKIGFTSNVYTTNLLFSNLLPHRTAMWAQKLSEISFEFNEVTYDILERAYYNLEDEGSRKEISSNSFFLDMLMYMTYDSIRK